MNAVIRLKILFLKMLFYFKILVFEIKYLDHNSLTLTNARVSRLGLGQFQKFGTLVSGTQWDTVFRKWNCQPSGNSVPQKSGFAGLVLNLKLGRTG